MRAAVPFREPIQAFWRRDASTHVVCIMAIGALFAAAAYAGVHSSRYWDDLFRIVMLRSQQGWSGREYGAPTATRQGTEDDLRLLDPRDAFAQARVGLLKFSMQRQRHVPPPDVRQPYRIADRGRV